MTCTRRAIVVAGPPASGKTALIRWLQGYRGAGLRELLDIDTLNNWLVVWAGEPATVPYEHVEQLLVHYDMLTQRREAGRFAHLERLLDVVIDARIITLQASRAVLARRLEARIAGHVLRNDRRRRRQGEILATLLRPRASSTAVTPAGSARSRICVHTGSWTAPITG
jgi:hypothetical protein